MPWKYLHHSLLHPHASKAFTTLTLTKNSVLRSCYLSLHFHFSLLPLGFLPNRSFLSWLVWRESPNVFVHCLHTALDLMSRSPRRTVEVISRHLLHFCCQPKVAFSSQLSDRPCRVRPSGKRRLAGHSPDLTSLGAFLAHCLPQCYPVFIHYWIWLEI